MLTCSLVTILRLLLHEQFDPERTPFVIAEAGATLLGSAVLFFHAYLDAQRRHGAAPLFPRLRCCISGGAPKPPELHRELGRSLGGVGLDGKERARGSESYLKTGDLGVIEPSGNVRITGRLKDVIIRHGENISASEIEDVLYAHPKVADVAVIGLPDARTGERACAVVALAPGTGSLSLAELVEYGRAQGLAVQKLPEQLEILDSLPRNAMGKILKQKLRETYRR